MPTDVVSYSCLIISPSDVQAEREAIVKAIEGWNVHVGRGSNVRVDIARWETGARPEMGATPQDVINKQLVDDADFGIAVFWSRLGSPTTAHVSGSAEEIARLTTANKKVMVYLCDRPIPQANLVTDQYQRLQELKKEYFGKGLLHNFTEAAELDGKVSLHLTSLLHELRGPAKVDAATPAVSARPDIRVLVTSANLVIAGTKPRPCVKVEVQNHSSVALFMGGLDFDSSDGSHLWMRVDMTGTPIDPQKIEPGDSRWWAFDPASRELTDALGKARHLVNVVVRDKIGRRFEADAIVFALVVQEVEKQILGL